MTEKSKFKVNFVDFPDFRETLFPFPKMGILQNDYLSVKLVSHKVLKAPVQSNSLESFLP
jgi:hypothetical protein